MLDHRENMLLGVQFHKLMEARRNHFRAELAPLDVSATQARAIGHIGGMALRGTNICQRDLAEALDIKGASVTSLLKGLERKGLVVRSSPADDARVKQLFLTEKGQVVMEKCRDIMEQTEDRMEASLEPEELTELCRLLKKIRKSF